MARIDSNWTLDAPGIHDFSSTYLETLDEITARLRPRAAAHPVFGPLVSAYSEEQHRAAARAARERIEKAFNGEWDAYNAALRQQGAAYAAMGLRFNDWSDLTRDWAAEFIPALVERLGTEPARLCAALTTMQAFLDHAMTSLAESYMRAFELRVRSGEEELRATIESIADGVIATDGDGRVARVNAVAAALLESSTELLCGRVLDLRCALIASGESGELLYERERADGAKVVLSISRAPIARADGATRGEVLLLRDVSAAQRGAREIAQWKGLFESVPWALCIVRDRDATIELVNDAFCRLYRCDAASLVGKGIGTLYDPEAYAFAQAQYGERARRRGDVSFESTHARSDGAKFPVAVDVARIPGIDGAEAWALSIRDISERKQVEALRARGAELEEMNRHAQEASRIKSEFLANMSHELRTPLNSILGFAGLLRDGEVGALEERQLDFVQDIHASGLHLLRLINDVLDLSKVEAGKMTFEPERVDLRSIATEVTSILRGIALARRVAVETRVDERLSEAFIDAGRLRQILYNFLSNAIKFSREDSAVRVELLAEGADGLRLQVTDRGPGIDDEDVGRLFIEFEQLHRGRGRANTGTGLGLALTKRLVEAQGGTIGVRTERGVGSTFFAVLPLRTNAQAPSMECA